MNLIKKWFPNTAVGTSVVTLNLLIPTYVSATKLFVCPSSSSESASTSASMNTDNLSYAYAYFCNEKTPTAYCLMADQVGAKDGYFQGTDFYENLNHGQDGINALFVDGHVEWVPKGRVIERIPNGGRNTYNLNLRDPGV